MFAFGGEDGSADDPCNVVSLFARSNADLNSLRKAVWTIFAFGVA